MTKTRFFIAAAFGWILLPGLCDAQIPTQNLFRRAQYIQYLRLQRPRALDGPLSYAPYYLPQFPITCDVPKTTYDLWLNAEVSFARTSWYDAAKIYQGLIQTDSSFCDAYFRLAQCYVARNNLAQAHKILSIAARKFPTNPLLYTGLGQLYIFLGRPLNALAYFNTQMSLFPRDPEGYLGACWCQFELRDYQASVSNLEIGRDLLIMQINQAATFGAPTAEQTLATSIDYLYIFESMLRFKLNENENAWQAVQMVQTESDPEVHAFKRYCEGIYFYNKGEDYYDKAKKKLMKVAPAGIVLDEQIAREVGIKVDPADLRSLVLLERYNDKLKSAPQKSATPLADSLFQNRKIAEASIQYNVALQNDSSNCHTLLRLADCYNALKRDEEALELYRYALRKFPNEPKLALLVARQLVQLKQYDAAIEAYLDAAKLDKKDPRGYFGACLIMACTNQFRRALDLYNANLSYLDKSKFNWVKGMLYFKLNLPVLALQSLPEEHTVYSNYYRGLSYRLVSGDTWNPKAAEHIIEAIRLGAIVDAQTMEMVGLDPKTAFQSN